MFVFLKKLCEPLFLFHLVFFKEAEWIFSISMLVIILQFVLAPKFFEDNPALKHRLVPWLLRDLNVLLGNDDETIRFVMSMILRMISK